MWKASRPTDVPDLPARKHRPCETAGEHREPNAIKEREPDCGKQQQSSCEKPEAAHEQSRIGTDEAAQQEKHQKKRKRAEYQRAHSPLMTHGPCKP
jgi:hypothetical protein